jgi:hypothetical protein
MAWLFDIAKQTYTQNIENKGCQTVNPGGELRQKVLRQHTRTSAFSKRHTDIRAVNPRPDPDHCCG